ncbi:MAG: peroxide stress protein YaaA [Bacteroidales bacterium]
MLIVLSPAKTLDFESDYHLVDFSFPIFIKEAEKLIKLLRRYKPGELSGLMDISAKLADLNFERYLKWTTKHELPLAKPSVFAFKGDVYIGLDALNLTSNQLNFLNKNVRILSGLYGILKPFDLINAYRLEMGTPLKNTKGKDLYSFWSNLITGQIIKDIDQSDGEKVLINLASNEYFQSVKRNKIKFRIITPSFKEFKDNEYRFISFNAKKARGLMTRFITTEKIENPEEIKHFNLEGYRFNEDLSKGDHWLFTR